MKMGYIVVAFWVADRPLTATNIDPIYTTDDKGKARIFNSLEKALEQCLKENRKYEYYYHVPILVPLPRPDLILGST